jgi:hypothetical protein
MTLQKLRADSITDSGIIASHFRSELRYSLLHLMDAGVGIAPFQTGAIPEKGRLWLALPLASRRNHRLEVITIFAAASGRESPSPRSQQLSYAYSIDYIERLGRPGHALCPFRNYF